MTFEHKHNLPLSEKGRQRRAHMLGELQHAMHRHHARRRRRRTITSACALALVIALGAATWLSIAQRNTPSPPEMTQQTPPTNQPEYRLAGAQVRIISTTPDIAEKYVSSSRPQRITIIESDDELLRTLAEFGRPTGLIRINGEVRLTNPQLARRINAGPPGQSPSKPRDPSL